MSRRSATPDLPADVALGVVTLDVAMAAAGGAVEGTAPEWIKLTPAGTVKTRDGRTFRFDPAVLAARFLADGIDVPVDVDHAISRKAMFGERADAHAWIVALDARADGLWGRVDWLDSGRAVLAARTHRYVSPTFHHDDTGLATWLHSAALVSAPALAMPAIASAGAGSNPEKTMLKAVAKALGLAEGADEAQCLSAIATLQAGQAGQAGQAAKVDKALYDQAVANLAASQAQLAELSAAERKKKVDGVIEAGLKAKKILPAQKDHFASLCATDEGLAHVEALLGATPANLQASGLDDRQVPETGGAADPITLAAKASAYQKQLADGGQTISYADAVVAVAAKEGKQ